MTARLSTGLVNDMLDSSSLKAALEGGGANFLIKFYTGSRPASADDAPSGTLLVTVSNNATGNVLAKNGGETWKGTCVADGVIGWARLARHGDAGGSCTTAQRMDFTV